MDVEHEIEKNVQVIKCSKKLRRKFIAIVNVMSFNCSY